MVYRLVFRLVLVTVLSCVLLAACAPAEAPKPVNVSPYTPAPSVLLYTPAPGAKLGSGAVDTKAKETAQIRVVLPGSKEALLLSEPLAADEVALVVNQGSRPSGGWGVQVQSVRLSGQTVTVSAIFWAPPAGAITTSVITDPQTTVRIKRSSLPTGPLRVVLNDQFETTITSVDLP